ncbi:MAG: WYL domain-containing protein [Bacteroidia bacterium]|nr:MAG: WYL domain-containing protein [Bacteroidia bacterium]
MAKTAGIENCRVYLEKIIHNTMSRHSTIRRYALIIEKTDRRLYPSFKEVKDFLAQHGFEVSDRTIQRDIEQMRLNFGIEITYDRLNDGYYIDRDKTLHIDNFLRFLQIAQTAELLTESLQESRDTLKYIDFESQGELRGSELLKPLLSAIRNHREVVFLHENFMREQPKLHRVRPYLLKEYLNRWYLVSTTIDTNDCRIFGIDRISYLEITAQTFEPDPKLKPQELFRNTIGLTYSESEPQPVELSFTPLQGKYVKALPMHHSQEIIADSESELLIRMFINPNLEFRQRVMMLGDAVRVISPDWLVKEVKNALDAARQRYQ